MRKSDCPKTPISWPKERRGEPRATVPLISSNYSEGPISTQVLLCDGLLNQVPILQAWDWLWFKVVKGTIQRGPKYHTQSLVCQSFLRLAPAFAGSVFECPLPGMKSCGDYSRMPLIKYTLSLYCSGVRAPGYEYRSSSTVRQTTILFPRLVYSVTKWSRGTVPLFITIPCSDSLY